MSQFFKDFGLLIICAAYLTWFAFKFPTLMRRRREYLEEQKSAGDQAPTLTVGLQISRNGSRPTSDIEPASKRRPRGLEITFDYAGSAGDTTRTVNVIRVLGTGRVTSIDAYCHLRKAERGFIISRMDNIVVDGRTVRRNELRRILEERFKIRQ